MSQSSELLLPLVNARCLSRVVWASRKNSRIALVSCLHLPFVLCVCCSGGFMLGQARTLTSTYVGKGAELVGSTSIMYCIHIAWLFCLMVLVNLRSSRMEAYSACSLCFPSCHHIKCGGFLHDHCVCCVLGCSPTDHQPLLQRHGGASRWWHSHVLSLTQRP